MEERGAATETRAQMGHIERTPSHPSLPHLAPRQQLLWELARGLPNADLAAIETYLFLAQVASDFFVKQQAFLARYELSEGKLVVLQLLHQAPQHRLTPSPLAHAAGVTRGTMTGLLAGLERSGLVTRTQHPEDGRMAHIELTKRALEIFEWVLPERVGQILQLMSTLTADEQRQLRALLEQVERGLPALNAS
jgi:DNA-binding MarR family transcriptional regulator